MANNNSEIKNMNTEALKQKLKEILEKIIEHKEKIFIYTVIGIFMFIFFYVVIFTSYPIKKSLAYNVFDKWISMINLKPYNSCNNQSKKYVEDGMLIDRNTRLCNYYVASSYKSYLVGGTNGWVCPDAIRKIIHCGARLIDIDIFNYPKWGKDAEPIVANGQDAGQRIYSRNLEYFQEVALVIRNCAFNSGQIVKYNEPLFINLRLNVEGNFYTLDKLAYIIKDMFDDRLLPRKYSYQRKSIAAVSMEELKGKIVIFADKYFEHSKLNELVNYSPLKNFMRITPRLSFNDSMDLNEHATFNKRWIGMVLNDDADRNYDFYGAQYFGCQFYLINYAINDYFMEEYIKRFQNESFIFKPYKRRYHPITVKLPEKQDPRLSFRPIKIENNFFQATI